MAVKVLKQPNPSERVMERFFREARAVARLDHPNIVAVHDAGFDDGRCWVAYQLVGGRPLWWYRDHHRMDADDGGPDHRAIWPMRSIIPIRWGSCTATSSRPMC